MSQLKPIAPGVASLSLLVLLERFAYYGFRSIIVLFVIEELNVESEKALYYYGVFTTLFYVAAVPMGLLSDFVLKHKRALILGGAISTVGYIMIIFSPELLLVPSLCLLVLGVGLTKPNLDVLLGRLYPKKMRSRDVGFVCFYLAINLGAALASFGIGYSYERYGYSVGFGFVAVASLLMFIGSIAFKILFKDNESKTEPRQSSDLSITLIFLVILVSVLFWGGYELVGAEIYRAVDNQRDFLDPSGLLILQGLNAVWLFPLAVVIGVAWSFWKNPASLKKFSYGFVIMAVGYAFFYFMDLSQITGSGFIGGFVVFSFFISLAEMFISPIVISYLTRLSPVKVSATIMGLFYALSSFGNKIFGYLSSELEPKAELFLMIGFIGILISAALFFINRYLAAKDVVN